MKKILYLFTLVVLITKLSYSQTPPVAVNDTFVVAFESDSLKIIRGYLTNNDYDAESNTIIVDTVIYNGTQQFLPTYFIGTLSWIRLKEFTYKWTTGYFGLDSLTYVITDNGNPTGFDTATIYIYVKRKEYEKLDLNNVRAHIDKEVLFNDRSIGTSGFSVPKQQNETDPFYATIYAANLWVAGIDQNGTKKAYGSMFGESSFNQPFHTGDAGPIMDSSSYEKYSYQWDRVWKVSQSEIDYHRAVMSGTVIDTSYSVPEAILSWPGNGYLSPGAATFLAPFYDIDGDGVYNPMVGDYPLIKGQQAVYFIKNDERTQQTYTNSPLGIEIHGMAYAYDCPDDSAINNTIFLDYKVYNRSSEDYHDVYLGFWCDFDIGKSTDDFVGCDVQRGTFYGYNGDAYDEDNNGIDGYQNYLPAQGVVFLKGPKKDNDGMDNPFTTSITNALDSNGIPYAGLGVGYGDGIVDNEFLGMEYFMYYYLGAQIDGNGDPNNANDFYNYLTGRWVNGNSMVWGGDGNPLVSGTGSTAKYMFPYDTDPLFWGTTGIPQTSAIWDEASVGNAPLDRRGVGSTGPFTFPAGESREMTLAFVFGRDYTAPGDNMAGVVVMQERIDSIRSYYLNDFQSVCGGTLTSIDNELKQERELQVYPNPFNEQVTIYYELQNKTAKLKVFNIYGQVVTQQLLNQKQTVIDLSNQSNGIYFVQIIDGKNRLVKKMIKQ